MRVRIVSAARAVVRKPPSETPRTARRSGLMLGRVAIQVKRVVERCGAKGGSGGRQG